MAENNSTILASVWLKGTNDFQQRVPDPTQAGISATVSALLDPLNNDLYTQFVDTLVKRIGMVKVQSDTWKNPLAGFKGANMLYGSSIQEIAPKWIKAHSYSFDSTLLDVTRPEVAEWFHSINRFDKYPISINEVDTRKAFTDEYGLNSLLTSFLQAPVNADEYDEYRIMMQLIAEYESKWGFFKYNLSNDVNTTEGATELLTQIRAFAGKWKYPSKLYNANLIDVPVFVKDASELMLLITPDAEAYMDVNVLSSLFHVELADIDVRRIIVDEFPVSTCKALLTTRDWFVCHDTVKQMTSFYDPSNMTTNYWYQRQGIYSMSPFVPAVMFTYGDESSTISTVTQDVTSLSIDPASVTINAGETVQFTPSIIGAVTASPADTYIDGIHAAPDSVTYDVECSGTELNTRTYVDVNNVLHTQKTLKSGDVLTVTATSTYMNPSGETKALAAKATVTIK